MSKHKFEDFQVGVKVQLADGSKREVINSSSTFFNVCPPTVARNVRRWQELTIIQDEETVPITRENIGEVLKFKEVLAEHAADNISYSDGEELDISVEWAQISGERMTLKQAQKSYDDQMPYTAEFIVTCEVCGNHYCGSDWGDKVCESCYQKTKEFVS